MKIPLLQGLPLSKAFHKKNVFPHNIPLLHQPGNFPYFPMNPISTAYFDAKQKITGIWEIITTLESI